MNIQRIAAFSDAGAGGNPAGILIADHFPDEVEMRRIAKVVGYSETAFAMPDGAADRWRIRYFSPESEVPFCGHATIALGAALAEHAGNGRFALRLNSAEITVEAEATASGYRVALQSPPTHSAAARAGLVEQALALFGYDKVRLDPALSPAEIHAGADHLVMALKHRRDLAAMTYDLGAGRKTDARERPGHQSCSSMSEATPRLTFATRSPPAECWKTPRQARPPQPLPGICAISNGPMATGSRSSRART